MSNVATGSFTVPPRAGARAQAMSGTGHRLLGRQWNGRLSGGLMLETVDRVHQDTLEDTLPEA
ncbi:hypothetical protein [Deinococcus aerophilus]|uniref:Uncharacterized protein n=1 Tax=Deinococcus aerophilus TaxID=522488 RepID=A0ABQ2GHZ2_9DEIO|nr:hypothetical protein [Deinococcus aerophilus]GGL97052.1 hypothetical protein GCM10010841_01800 [Deinococcus aerophilus]